MLLFAVGNNVFLLLFVVGSTSTVVLIELVVCLVRCLLLNFFCDPYRIATIITVTHRVGSYPTVPVLSSGPTTADPRIVMYKMGVQIRIKLQTVAARDTISSLPVGRLRSSCDQGLAILLVVIILVIGCGTGSLVGTVVVESSETIRL